MGSLEDSREIKWFEIEMPVRGCSFDLKQIQQVYGEIDELNRRERDRIIGSLEKPAAQSEEDFRAFKALAHDTAFKLTVSVIGSEHTAKTDQFSKTKTYRSQSIRYFLQMLPLSGG